MAAPAFLDSGALVDATSGTTIGPVPLPAGAASGDVAILSVISHGSTTLSAPTGWTAFTGGVQANADLSSGVFWRRLDGATGDNIPTVSSSASFSTINSAGARIRTYSGVITSGTPFDAVTGSGPTENDTPTSGAVTTTGVDRLIVSMVGMANDAVVVDGDWSTLPAAGWTLDGVVDNWNYDGDGTLLSVSKVQATAATVAAAAIGTYISTVTFWRSFTIALIPAAVGPSAPTDPTSVVATTASTEATVTWVDGTGNPTPTWDTEYRVDGGSWTTSASDIAQGVQTRTQTGLTNGTLVRFRVRGQNTEGDSAWVESNDVTVGSIPLEILDPTSSGSNTAGNPQNVAYPAHSVGDLIIQSIAIDANVTATVPTTGPNGETITAITTNVNPGAAGPRFSAWWWIATGAETAGNISVTLSAAEQASSEAFRVPAGAFDPVVPVPDISAAGTQTSGTGATVTMPSFTATVAGGLVVAMGGVDADPMDATFSPAGWSDVITHDVGAVSSFVGRRTALTTVSESISAAAFGINTGDTASVIGFVIAPAPAETVTDTTGTPSTVTTVSAVGQATGTADPTGTSTAVSAVSAVAQAGAQADPTGTGTVVTSVAAVGQAAAQTAATGTPTVSVTVSATGQADAHADPTGAPSVVVAVSAVGQAASTIATTGAPTVVVTVSATGTAAATADPTGTPSVVVAVTGTGQATGPFPATIQATGETDLWAGASGDIADDPWIWRNPAAPASSFILGASKSAGSDGGVYTFDLDGTEVDQWLAVTINGVDGRDLSLYPGVDTDWDGRVLVLATDRTNDQLRFGFLASNGTITSAGTTSLAFEPYGCTLYVSPVDGAVYAFVSEATGGSDALRQHELTITGDTVTSTQVRSLDTASLAEGMACYDPGELFFLGEEDAGLYVYDAEPTGGTSRTTIDTVAGNLTADVEGVTVIEPIGGQPGYIVVSSQGASDFQIYDLESPHGYRSTFEITAGTFESVNDCDGLHAHRAYFGSTYPDGILVAHDATNPTASNYKIVDLADLFGDAPDIPTGTPSAVTTVAGTGQASSTASPTGTPTVVTAVSAAGPVDASADPTGTPTVVVAVSGTGVASTTSAPTGTPTVVTVAAGTGQVDAAADPTGSPSVVVVVAGTGTADADADPTGTPSVVTVVSGTGVVGAGVAITGTPSVVASVTGTGQADAEADPTGTASVVATIAGTGQTEGQADPTGTPSVVVSVTGTGPAAAATGTTGTSSVVTAVTGTGTADAEADPTGTPSVVTVATGTGQADTLVDTTGTPTVVTTVTGTGPAAATTLVTGTPQVVVVVSAAGQVDAAADPTGSPSVVVVVSATGQLTTAPTHPITLTIRDHGHTATIRDTGHTATIQETHQ